MARADEIRAGARKSLEIYKADSHYQYSKLHASELSAKEMKKYPVTNVLGYVSGLEDYIEKDDLVSMRRHEDANRYLDSFEQCENAIKKIFAERKQESQLNLFSEVNAEHSPWVLPQANVIFHESEDESESDEIEITM